MAEVRWTVTAAEDLREIEDWIAKDSALHAVVFVDRLVQSVEILRTMPEVGKVVPEFDREDLREMLFGNYRIVYQRSHDHVLILRVVHGARDLGRLGNRKPWELE